MASVIKIGDKYRCQVRYKGHKHTKTFEKHKEATEWGRKIEAAIDAQQSTALDEELLVRELITQYRIMRAELGNPVSPTTNTHYMLNHLDEDLGVERIIDLNPRRLAQWAAMRREQGAGGYTVNMELSLLGTVVRHTASFLEITLPDVVGSARPLLHYGQLISGGSKRTRKPTEEEAESLFAWLDLRNSRIADAVRVGYITGMRRGELARISRSDLDHKRKAVLVRKRKHPRMKEARDEWVPLLGDSWAIVMRQAPADDPDDHRIFPVSREALTDAVTAGTRELGIPDLHLHDMRRGATSTLRELGFDGDARKKIVGHRSDEVHERYIAIDLEDLHAQYDAAIQRKQQRPQRQPSDSDRPPSATESRPSRDGS